MKSTVNKAVENIVPIQFPCVMEYLGDNDGGSKGLVVLFKDKNFGVCLYPGTSNRKVGLFLDCWADADDSETWKPFKGSITIES